MSADFAFTYPADQLPAPNAYKALFVPSWEYTACREAAARISFASSGTWRSEAQGSPYCSVHIFPAPSHLVHGVGAETDPFRQLPHVRVRVTLPEPSHTRQLRVPETPPDPPHIEHAERICPLPEQFEQTYPPSPEHLMHGTSAGGGGGRYPLLPENAPANPAAIAPATFAFCPLPLQSEQTKPLLKMTIPLRVI